MKAPKTPAISGATKILSFDLESNGLHGQAFAVAAVVVDATGEIVDSFSARIKITGEVDEWVKENVIPVIGDMQVTHGDYRTMCDAFWRWFVRAQESCDYVVVSNGYPVEYRFLADCQDNNLEERYWQHPFPILELPSLLIGLGRVSESARLSVITRAAKGQSFVRHHPRDDAMSTALTTHAALKSTTDR